MFAWHNTVVITTVVSEGGIPGAKKSIVTIRSAVKEVKNVKAVKNLIDRTPAPVAAPVEEVPAEEAKAE